MDGRAAGRCPSWRTWWHPKRPGASGTVSPSVSWVPKSSLRLASVRNSKDSPSSASLHVLGSPALWAAPACFANQAGALQADRRPMNKIQACLFVPLWAGSGQCISNEVFAVSCFCLLINENLLPALLLAYKDTGKCEEKAVNWADLGALFF